MKKLLLLPLMVTAMSGCSVLAVGESRFACEEEGTCKSIREVYESRYEEELDTGEAADEEGGFFSDSVDYLSDIDWFGFGHEPETKEWVEEPHVSDDEWVEKSMNEGFDNSRPLRVDHGYVREESRLLSTYITPYTDGGNTAHLGNEMVTEIVPRKWRVVEVETRNRGGMVTNRLKMKGASQGDR